ncbi:hypothetical protein GKO46_13110 [SAR202 cluster bacterium JH702]|uniref:Prohead serine protease domain-containing protein n=1 Tax=Candidatus Lucifugimonas marina TaxID=3038979 RepID=A0ABD4XTQ1_9CHLR|nr:hypothetical protein [SAR202 cluster bacterium JH702]
MTTLIDRARERILEGLDRYERGLAAPPTLYSLGFVSKSSGTNEPMTFIASTEEPDRSGDVIVQSGWELSSFRKNPVYMWGHDYARPPIGTVPKVWLTGRELRNTVRFDGTDPFAKSVEGKFKRGVLKAQSVGFRPLEFDRQKDGSHKFTRMELLEISAVPIPMNQSALRVNSLVSSASSLWIEDDPFERLARAVRRYFKALPGHQ